MSTAQASGTITARELRIIRLRMNGACVDEIQRAADVPASGGQVPCSPRDGWTVPRMFPGQVHPAVHHPPPLNGAKTITAYPV